MAICKECGSFVPDRRMICPSCGARIEGYTDRFAAVTVNQDGKRVLIPPSRAQRQRGYVAPFNERLSVSNAQTPHGQAQTAAVRKTKHEEEALYSNDRNSRSAQKSIDRDARVVPLQSDTRKPAEGNPRRPVGKSAVIGAGDYLVSMILVLIPLVGLLLGILWARGAINPNKRNFGKAAIVLQCAMWIAGGIVFALTRWVFHD